MTSELNNSFNSSIQSNHQTAQLYFKLIPCGHILSRNALVTVLGGNKHCPHDKRLIKHYDTITPIAVAIPQSEAGRISGLSAQILATQGSDLNYAIVRFHQSLNGNT